MRPKILLLTRNLPPLVGGMERLNWHMAQTLSHRAEIRVLGPSGSSSLAPAGVHVDEVPLRPLWKFLWQLQWRALREARSWRPDLVLAGSGLTALPALLAARSVGARSAAYVHGLDVAIAHPIYRALWLPALARMDRIVANSTPTAALAVRAGVERRRIGLVHPGVSLPPTSTDARDVDEFRARHGLGGRPLLLSVGRLSARKGLREFVTQALPAIVAAQPDVMLLVVGDAPSDALHAEAQSPDSIRHAAEQAGVADHLRFLGTITDDTLLGIVYRAADVHVFPVRDLPGDPEGFGMVCVEAAVHGLPTVAFATGGVVDAVEDDVSGRLVACGDYAALAEAVVSVMARRGELSSSCRSFGERFAWPHFGHALFETLFRP